MYKMNNTVGEIEVLTTHHYTLGVILLFLFLAVSILNSLLLVSFYNLRHFPFVQNTMAMISLIVTDLVNASLLTPTLLSWYLISPPHSYGECVLKSFPFMLTNFTSLLSMTVFCVHRLIVMKKITVGEFKVRTKYCGIATCFVWVFAILGVSIPYIVWNSSEIVLLDCRRVLFSNVQFSLVYFTVLFDIPLVIMNATLVLLIILFMRYRARVGAVQNIEMVFHRTRNLNGRSTRVQAFSVGSDTDVFGDADKGVESTFSDIQIETIIDVKQRPRTLLSVDISTEFSEGNDHILTNNCPSITKPENIIIQTRHTSNFDLSHIDSVFENKQNQNRNQAMIKNIQTDAAVPEDRKRTSLHDGRVVGNNLCNKNNSARTNAECSSACMPSSEMFNQNEKRDQGGFLANDLKQFLVTMGVLVIVYDVTVLPLLLDMTIGGVSPSVTIPHALNSMCFLNSFFNPIVYLIRMEKARREMKRLVTTCWCKKNAPR